MKLYNARVKMWSNKKLAVSGRCQYDIKCEMDSSTKSEELFIRYF